MDKVCRPSPPKNSKRYANRTDDGYFPDSESLTKVFRSTVVVPMCGHLSAAMHIFMYMENYIFSKSIS